MGVIWNLTRLMSWKKIRTERLDTNTIENTFMYKHRTNSIAFGMFHTLTELPPNLSLKKLRFRNVVDSNVTVVILMRPPFQKYNNTGTEILL